MNGHVTITRARDLNDSLYHLLKRASQAAADILAAHAGKGGLTQRQFAVLSCLAENAGASQTDIVNRTGIDRSTLADLAARMEERGYIRRESCPSDRRAKQLFLEPAGRKALAAMAPVMAEVDRALLEMLTPAQQRAVFGILKQLASEGGMLDSLDAAIAVSARPPAPDGGAGRERVVDFPVRMTRGR